MAKTVKDLKANPQNPRKISDQKLQMLEKSLAEFGDLGAIVFNQTTKQLVGGHQRVKLLPKGSNVFIEKTYKKPTKTGTVAEGYVELNGERFKYREVEWDDIKEKAANIAANKGAGEWELPQLSKWLQDIGDFGFDLNLTMFDEDERAAILNLKKVEGKCDEDEVPHTPKKAKTRLGDIYQLGNHRLMCGDSTSIDAVEKLMNGKKADLWLTDPPYGVSYQSNGAKNNHAKIENDDLPLEEMGDFWASVAANTFIVCSNKAAYYWFACQGGDQMMMMMMSISRSAWKVRHELIWVKDSLVMGRCDYHYKHEPILYGWKKEGTHEWCSDRKQSSVLEFARPKISKEHPTMKPVELVEYLMGNSSKPGQIVLDTFGGSGTTLIAAEKSGRCAYLMELSPQYCDVIVARYEKYTGNVAKLLTDADAVVSTKSVGAKKAPQSLLNNVKTMNVKRRAQS